MGSVGVDAEDLRGVLFWGFLDGGFCCGGCLCRFEEIGQWTEDVVNFVTGETVAEFLDAFGSLVELGHDGVQVGLFLRFQNRAFNGDRRGPDRRRAG